VLYIFTVIFVGCYVWACICRVSESSMCLIPWSFMHSPTLHTLRSARSRVICITMSRICRVRHVYVGVSCICRVSESSTHLLPSGHLYCRVPESCILYRSVSESCMYLLTSGHLCVLPPYIHRDPQTASRHIRALAACRWKFSI